MDYGHFCPEVAENHYSRNTFPGAKEVLVCTFSHSPSDGRRQEVVAVAEVDAGDGQGTTHDGRGGEGLVQEDGTDNQRGDRIEVKVVACGDYCQAPADDAPDKETEERGYQSKIQQVGPDFGFEQQTAVRGEQWRAVTRIGIDKDDGDDGDETPEENLARDDIRVVATLEDLEDNAVESPAKSGQKTQQNDPGVVVEYEDAVQYYHRDAAERDDGAGQKPFAEVLCLPEDVMYQGRVDGRGGDNQGDSRRVVGQLDGIVFGQEVETAAA